MQRLIAVLVGEFLRAFGDRAHHATKNSFFLGIFRYVA